MGLMAEPLFAERASPRTHGLVRDFGSWMTAEQRRIFALCQRFLEDRDEADSATQDVFLKAYQNLPKLEDPAKFPGWLKPLQFSC